MVENAKKLPKKTQYLWQARIGTALLCVAAVTAFFIKFSLWMLLPTAIILFLSFLFVFAYLPRYFSSYSISSDGKAIIVRKGVIFKMTYIMPYPRMVFATVYSSPISAKLGVSGVIIKAARGWLILPEMDNADTERLVSVTAGENNENGV